MKSQLLLLIRSLAHENVAKLMKLLSARTRYGQGPFMRVTAEKFDVVMIPSRMRNGFPAENNIDEKLTSKI